MMKHEGGCHCGKVRYAVEVDITKGMACNCSICAKRGSILAFTPEENFKLLAGANEQTEYLFNKHRIHHVFCKTCGILSFARSAMPDGKKMVAINLRCIDGIDVEKIQIQMHDGKSA